VCALALLALACQPPTTTAALDDTPENRAAQIDRYLVAQPPAQMMNDMVENMSARVPDEQRARFVELMTKQLDVTKLDAAMRESLAKNFTAEELRALADFYGSEIGKSAMAKFGSYMSDVMPTLQAEIMAAVGRAQSEFEKQPAAGPPAEVPASPKEPEPPTTKKQEPPPKG
jgi:hypothetical protein